jgi:hypothetical protein
MILLAVLWLCAPPRADAQILTPCTNSGTNLGIITPTVPWQTYPCIKGGEYLRFYANAGERFTFSFCFGGGNAVWDTQISVYFDNGTPAPEGFDDDLCFPASHLWNWKATTAGWYRIEVTEWPCASGSSCGILAYKSELPANGPGSTCGNPYPVSTLPFEANGMTTCGFGTDYNSTTICASTYANDSDFVFVYNGTAGQCISIYTNNTFTYTGLFLMRGCPGSPGATCIAFDEGAAYSPYLTNVTLPTTATYYIIVDGLDAAFPDCTPFDLRVETCVAVGQGQNCATAFPIPSLPYSQNGFTTCGRGDTYGSGSACGSPYMDGEDFLFRYTSPGNECIAIDVTNTFSYTGVFVYNGCPNLVGTTCIAQRGSPNGDPQIRNVNLTAPGTYYIMVSTWPTPNCTPFNMSVTSCVPFCTRNPNPNDVCLSATPIGLGLNDTVCGTLAYSFTPDVSTDLDNEFCGSIENNAWFRFVADSTTMTFRVDVPDCMGGFGIQGQVFQTTDCINYNPVSACWNPQFQSNGAMQATGMVVGQTYYLMLDGYAGDDCTFQLYRTRPLPVEWGAFTAVGDGQRVQLDWVTTMEENVSGFTIQRGQRTGKGRDNMRWEDAALVRPHGAGAGASYTHTDTPPYSGQPWFYRIQETDINGLASYSDVVAVEIEGPDKAQLNRVYPNPSSTYVRFGYYAPQAMDVRVALYNLTGQKVYQHAQSHSQAGNYELSADVADLPDGIYLYALAVGQVTFKGKVEILH